ncbi:chemotaxis protein CheY [Solibacillus merdavium]|uniref:Chemotaxis protein CheY n=1 Tax=Solibacillus merdavium TaxID=2762218 RepID=A0ABR8XPW5_9BACL|nr:chemotaxis protein CheY [Solibacillus merdavium]MBD8033988.1 chemotaxis protein CheY [Solibacillus merdavium]
MTIAVVVNDEGIVTPIVEGTILRIIQKDHSIEDFRNPALDLTEGRRGATLRKAIEQGATTFIAPPETFCELSYKKAKEEQISFINIAANQSFAQVIEQVNSGEIQISKELPAEEVVPSAPAVQ